MASTLSRSCSELHRSRGDSYVAYWSWILEFERYPKLTSVLSGVAPIYKLSRRTRNPVHAFSGSSLSSCARSLRHGTGSVQEPSSPDICRHIMHIHCTRIVVASATSAGCDVLCVQVLGGRPPGDWAREGAVLCTWDVCASASCGVGCDHL